MLQRDKQISALVVDDDPVVRKAADEYLSSDGFSVMEAGSGAQAMVMIGSERPGIVLLDVSMPEIDGYETCARIRGDGRTTNLPVLMMMDDGDCGSIRRAYESGATDIISKPLDRELLSYRVRCVMSLHQTLERLWELEDRSAAIVQALPDMVFILGRDGTVVDVTCSDAQSEFIIPPEEAVGRNLKELLPGRIARNSLVCINNAIETGEMQVFEYMLPVNRRKSYYEARIKSFGKDTALALVRNITERRLSEFRLQSYQRRLEKQVAQRTEKLTQTISRLESEIEEKKAAERKLKNYRDRLEQLVELRTNDLNDTVSRLMTEVDIRKQHEEKISHLAYHDELTGLPNRTLFSKKLWSELENARSHGRSIALMYIDLDNFKNINDSLGHTIGDFILCEVGKRLAHITRKDDPLIKARPDDGASLVSRLGGDEFILLLTEIEEAQDVEKVAERIIDRMSAPINLDCHEIFITPSIGIALYPEHGYDTDTLLMNADMAMYKAKSDGKNTYKFYSSSMSEESMHRLMLENDLHRALDRDELSVHFQPQFEIMSGGITCIEALLRWEHRRHGLIMPDTFIPIAEQHGLIIPIGELVFRKVCEQIMAWRNKGIAPVKVAVNVSGRQFQHNFPLQLSRMLEESGVPADLIELEITESSIMRDPAAAIRILNDLRALGFSLAIDDFGTGYSSLNYLRKFPIDALKIDRSFVKDILVDRDNDAIVKAIIAMAHSMKIKVVAEGVENRKQIEFLTEHGCDCVQGYYYCRPVDASGMEDVLVQRLGNCA